MLASLRRSIRQLGSRRRLCALCGTECRHPKARYGLYRFCSRKHLAEWQASTVL